MEFEGRRLLVCNCEHTMEIDGKALAKALGADQPLEVHSHLCRAEIEAYAGALKDEKSVLVACTQEAPLFRELAEQAGTSAGLAFTNIRERAGWCADKKATMPKTAALLAEAALDTTPAGTITLESDGLCLVYGDGQAALDIGRELGQRLNVTVLLKSADDVVPPPVADVPVFAGRITRLSGHFGAFELMVDGYAPVVPSSRKSLEFQMGRDNAASKCALVLDLSGDAPLVSGHGKRDGYFHVDPNHPAALSRAMFEIADMVGEFEKPIYVRHHPDICAHSRNGQTGCTRCLDVCPASAITPAGDVVAIDAAICGGCGSCHSVCPTGAAAYDYPGRIDLARRVQTLARIYRNAGGKRPVLLIHDERRGAEMVSVMARFGRGLPANVIPLSLNEVTVTGHDLMAVALAAGFEQIAVFAHPERAGELTGLEEQVGLMNAFMAAMGYGDQPRVHLISEQDPDAIEAMLYDLPALDAPKAAELTPTSDKRALARLALAHLNETGPDAQALIELPDQAPYGRIHIDTDGCTLCLACVSTCPSNALQDNPDLPQVKFVEQACVQCGLCKITCPENVITLEPRFNFEPEAMTPIVLNEEEPFACIRCGRPFGTKSSVERIAEKLGGKHWMFESEDAANLIKMCDTCRIEAQAEGGRDPMAMGTRPKIRTTEDYFAAEEALRSGGDSNGKLAAEDFLKED